MQTLKSRPVIIAAELKRVFVRTAVVNAASIQVNEDTPQRLKSWKEIPGPSSLPIIGQLHHFLPGAPYSKLNGSELLQEWSKEFGPIVKLDALLGRPTMIMLFDSDSIAQVLRGENWMPIRPGFDSLAYYRKYHNKTKEQSLRPTGLITDQGDNWKQIRSRVNPVMLQPKTIKLYSSVLDEVAQDMVARMRSIRDENNMLKGKFDIHMNLWALESIGVVALGTRLKCFDPNLAEESPARKLIQCVHDTFKLADQLDFQPSLWRYYPTKSFKKAMKLYEEQTELAKYFIQKASVDLKHKVDNPGDEKGVLEKLLEIDEEVAQIMITDMLMAGVDTAANTITATFYLLAINQDKQDKLREEIMSSEERTPYVKACIKESMRMMPVVGGNIRQASKEYELLGYRIPKDMFLAFAHPYLSMQDSEYPRANEYIPERWVVKKDDPLYYGNAHPFAYSPFGFGVRSCIGRRIAELETETFLAQVVKNFRIEWFGPPPKVVSTSLNYITGPFNFIFKDI